MVVHLAVVHAGGEICHMTAGASERELSDRLARYVRGQVDHQLCPADRDRVRSLLSEGRSREAVSLYFARVGRWDPERLATGRVELPEPPTADRDA